MKDSSITIRINEQEKAQLKAAAAQLDIPMSQLLRSLVRNFLENQDFYMEVG